VIFLLSVLDWGGEEKRIITNIIITPLQLKKQSLKTKETGSENSLRQFGKLCLPKWWNG
jgi:hypothetical protein